MNFSFSGCGYLGIYHIGVASCLKEHAPHLISKIGGASAGALVGCFLTCDVDFGHTTDHVLKLATKARASRLGPLNPTFNIVKLLTDGLNRMLPKDIHKRTSGRLFISLTRVSDGKNRIVSEFESKEDLIEALICSSFVPLYSGLMPPTFRGMRYVDGGISDNLPSFSDESTITVSPFSGESDICPPSEDGYNYLHFNLSNTSIQMTPSNIYRLSRALFPPDPKILKKMCEQGFDDALSFLRRNNVINCTRHQSICYSTANIGLTEQERKRIEEASALVEFAQDELDSCEDCANRQQEVATTSSLPQPVLISLQTAIESVQSGKMAFFYNSLYLVTLPYVVSVEATLQLAYRFMHWMPSLSQDMQWLFLQAVDYIRFFLKKYQLNARLNCQLDILKSNDSYGGGRKQLLPDTESKAAITTDVSTVIDEFSHGEELPRNRSFSLKVAMLIESAGVSSSPESANLSSSPYDNNNHEHAVIVFSEMESTTLKFYMGLHLECNG